MIAKRRSDWNRDKPQSANVWNSAPSCSKFATVERKAFRQVVRLSESGASRAACKIDAARNKVKSLYNTLSKKRILAPMSPAAKSVKSGGLGDAGSVAAKAARPPFCKGGGHPNSSILENNGKKCFNTRKHRPFSNVRHKNCGKALAIKSTWGPVVSANFAVVKEHTTYCFLVSLIHCPVYAHLRLDVILSR